MLSQIKVTSQNPYYRGHGGHGVNLEFGAQHGDDVIRGYDADEFAVFIDHGESDEVVFVKEFGDFVVAGGLVGEDKRLRSEREKRSILLGEYEFGEGNSTGQGTVGVDEIDGADGFDAAFEFAENADGVVHGGGDRQREEFSGHAAGGGFFAMFEKFDDFLAGLGLHLYEDLFGMILRKIGEQVGGGIGVHFLDDIGRAFGIERFDDRFLNFGIDFFQGFRGDIFVEGAEDGLPLVGGEVFDDVGDVGRVELGEALVGNFQLDPAGRIGFDEIDKSPGDGAERNPLQ